MPFRSPEIDHPEKPPPRTHWRRGTLHENHLPESAPGPADRGEDLALAQAPGSVLLAPTPLLPPPQPAQPVPISLPSAPAEPGNPSPFSPPVVTRATQDLLRTPPLGPSPGGPAPLRPVSSCCCRSRCWIDADYLLWWMKDGHVPGALLPEGPLPHGLSPGVFTGLTRRMAEGFDQGLISGGRVTVGYWLDPDQLLSLEAGGFLLEQSSIGAGLPADAATLLALATLSPGRGRRDRHSPVQVLLPPGRSRRQRPVQPWRLPPPAPAAAGRVSLPGPGGKSEALGHRRRVARSSGTGHRQSRGQVQDPDPVLRSPGRHPGWLPSRPAERGWHPEAGRGRQPRDRHRQRSQIGLRRIRRPRRSATPPRAASSPSRPTWASRRTTAWPWFPKFSLKLSFDLTPHMHVFAGYTFLYSSSVVRPGDQVDQVVNLSQICGPLIGPTRPLPLFRTTDFCGPGRQPGPAACLVTRVVCRLSRLPPPAHRRAWHCRGRASAAPPGADHGRCSSALRPTGDRSRPGYRPASRRRT